MKPNSKISYLKLGIKYHDTFIDVRFRVKQIQTNYVLNIGKRKISKSPLFTLRGLGKRFLSPHREIEFS